VAVAFQGRIRPLGRGSSFGGIFATILIHAALAGAIYFGHVKSPPPVEVPRDLIVTQLVAFGKPREKFWLPRIVQPPRPKAPAPTLNLTDDPNAKAAPKEAPKVEDADISKDLKRALKRAQLLAQAAPEEPAEGSLTGSLEGTSTQGVQGDPWATAVSAAIQSNWTTPVGLITDAELSRLLAKIKISIAQDGTLSNPTVVKSSGNPYFDDSCIQAVKATGKVPPPPAGKYRGLTVGFDGKKLNR
jgi:TonB family protein